MVMSRVGRFELWMWACADVSTPFFGHARLMNPLMTAITPWQNEHIVKEISTFRVHSSGTQNALSFAEEFRPTKKYPDSVCTLLNNLTPDPMLPSIINLPPRLVRQVEIIQRQKE
jgi:hypothetical protein